MLELSKRRNAIRIFECNFIHETSERVERDNMLVMNENIKKKTCERSSKNGHDAHVVESSTRLHHSSDSEPAVCAQSRAVALIRFVASSARRFQREGKFIQFVQLCFFASEPHSM